MKKIRKQIVSGLLGTTLVLNMPVASALTQKNITVRRGVTIYVDDQKIKPGDSNGNPVEPRLYNGTTYLPIRAVSAALNVPIAWDGTMSSAYLGQHNVYINDKKIVPTDANGKTVDVLLYKGTTYLPIRAVSNSFNRSVTWDSTDYSVYIQHRNV